MYTVNYASRRGEIWRWYWRAWMRPAGLWRYHVIVGFVFAFVFVVLLEPGAFRLERFLIVAIIITIACVALFPLWPQVRFKSVVRTLTINAVGLETAIGQISASRSWKDIRSIEESLGNIVITGNNNNAFIVPERAFATSRDRQEFFEAAQQWHRAAAP